MHIVKIYILISFDIHINPWNHHHIHKKPIYIHIYLVSFIDVMLTSSQPLICFSLDKF